jgi:hypothetical protein
MIGFLASHGEEALGLVLIIVVAVGIVVGVGRITRNRR